MFARIIAVGFLSSWKDQSLNRCGVTYCSTTFKTLNTPAANEALEMLNTILVTQNEKGSTLNVQNTGGCSLEMIGIYGQIVLNQKITNQNESLILPPFSGQYLVRITNSQNQHVIKRFVKLK